MLFRFLSLRHGFAVPPPSSEGGFYAAVGSSVISFAKDLALSVKAPEALTKIIT